MHPFIEEFSKRFFHENGAIVFQHFLTTNQLHQIVETSKTKRDGFLQNEHLKKIIAKMQLGTCISELMKKGQYQLGFMEFINMQEFSIDPNKYCVKPIHCFAYLQLDKAAKAPYLMQPLDILFIQAQRPITIQQEGLGLLIGVGKLQMQYIYNQQDPCTNELKKYGYGFGDKLQTQTHPLLK